jgi:hypothetical protein
MTLSQRSSRARFQGRLWQHRVWKNPACSSRKPAVSASRRFKFDKRSQLFIGMHNKTLSASEDRFRIVFDCRTANALAPVCVHRLAAAPMRQSHSSRLPQKPSSQAVLKLALAGMCLQNILELSPSSFRRCQHEHDPTAEKGCSGYRQWSPVGH